MVASGSARQPLPRPARNFVSKGTERASQHRIGLGLAAVRFLGAECHFGFENLAGAEFRRT